MTESLTPSRKAFAKKSDFAKQLLYETPVDLQVKLSKAQ